MKKSLFLLITSVIFFLSFASVIAAEQLEVHFIDVGQADSTLVITGDHYMLIDGGNPSSSQLIYSYLNRMGIDHLDYIVNTHGDSDHVGGLPAAVVCVDGKIGTVISPYTECEKERFIAYANKLEEYGLKISVPEKNDIFALGNAEFQILSAGGNNCKVDKSIILRLTYGNSSFIFTGDATVEDEFLLLSEYPELKSDVLKIGHHGSSTSTSEEFLNAVQPYYSIISCGLYNSYGHPSDLVLERLDKAGSMILRTDINGHIVLVSDGHNIYSYTQKNADGITGFSLIDEDQSVIKTERIKGAIEETYYEEQYVLNTYSKKFHLPDCEAIEKMNPWNKQEVVSTRNGLIDMGYMPCNYCRP